MKPLVMSIGGSIFNPDGFNFSFVKDLKNVLTNLAKKRDIVVVCGGGKTARNYIIPLRQAGVSEKRCELIGIGITRMNARFFINFFGEIASQHVPASMKEVRNLLQKSNLVFTGGLRFVPASTSDGTAAGLAHYFNTDFINMTNVKGLYTKDPKFKDAKFISEISFKDFNEIASKIKYQPGQHFVLDQNAAKIIKQHKIKTYIIGPDLNNLVNLINGKRFTGTVIC